MTEKLNICCIFNKAPSNRLDMFSRLFEADPEWMGRPDEIVVHDACDILARGHWNSARRLLKGELSGRFVYVYSHDNVDRSCIGLHEISAGAAYTLSIPVASLRKTTMIEAEQRFLHIHRVADSVATCMCLIGPELEADPGDPLANLDMSEVERPASLLTWIIASKQQLKQMPPSFLTAADMDSILLLRRRDALERVQFR